uniref:Uncharacterized protein n=1 Tax=Arundo donax TaxID=35708 RepID=A0A0A9APC7_ARUDO
MNTGLWRSGFGAWLGSATM